MKKLFTILLACIATMTFAQEEPGTFDTIFGTDGTYRFAPSKSHDFIASVLVREDGKLVTVGRSRTDGSSYAIYVSVHNSDGTLDTSYGENGYKYMKVREGIYMNYAQKAVLSNDGLLYIAGAAVVGCNGEGPVAEDLVQVAEEMGGGIGGLVGVAAFVDDGVDLQAVVLAGAVHELPQAGGTGARGGVGVHGAFHNGQVLQFLGDLVAAQRVLEEGVVVLAEAQHDIQTARHILEIVSDAQSCRS
mgnify:CR=1 FL=1